MLTAGQLRRMACALEVVLKHCVLRRQALKPKDADYLRDDIEAVHALLVETARKREASRDT